MKKGEILLNVLEILEDRVVDSFDLLMAFLNAGHNVTSKNIDYQYSKIKSERSKKDFLKQLTP